MKLTIVLTFLIIGFFPKISFATHIVGGELSLVALKNPTAFNTHLLSLNLYRDEINGNPNSKDSSVILGIYSKKNHTLINTIILLLVKDESIATNNSTCQTNNSLKTNLNIYSKEINLSPDVYSDINGYYIVWHRCCRNNIINNIKVPSEAGTAFYLEFPAQNLFINSSPVFNPLTIDYICADEPFFLNFSAKDADGDELRYSMSTPFNGLGDTNWPIPTPFLIGSDNYPIIQWEDGFSETNAIPGSVPLQINPQNGEMKVTANQLGLYVFGVKIEEYRNGIKIGEVRREAQIKVIECLNIEPSEPKILYKNTTIQEIIDCPESTFELKANSIDTGLSYHWLLNNQYLNNAKDSIFLAKEKGEYSVEVSFKNKCSRKSKSKITQIRFHTLPVLKLSPNNPSVCIGKIIKIQAPVNSNYTYQWLFENNPMIGFTKPYIEASNLGKYQIHITENTNNCTIKDSVILTGNPLPQITLNPQSVAVCENKNVEIKSTISNNQNNTYRYIWNINNTLLANETSPNISNNSKGKYKITVKDQKNCEASDSVQISNLNLPLVTFVKPDVVCGIHKQNILLKGLPANGTFEGTGVKGNTFNPSISKAGSFNINYYFTDSYGCTGKASQNILVENIKIDMPEKITVYEKEPKKIVNKVNQSNLSFEWTPTENLNDNRLQHPTAQIIDKNQTFTLKATSIHGCNAEDTVHLILDKRIRIPTIFTPNNDNINDELDIYGYDFFPDFQIDIFNRWGELVFSSKGYEEKFKGRNLSQIDLPQDTYCYKIKLGENRSDIQGVFVLKR